MGLLNLARTRAGSVLPLLPKFNRTTFPLSCPKLSNCDRSPTSEQVPSPRRRRRWRRPTDLSLTVSNVDGTLLHVIYPIRRILPPMRPFATAHSLWELCHDTAARSARGFARLWYIFEPTNSRSNRPCPCNRLKTILSSQGPPSSSLLRLPCYHRSQLISSM